MMFVRLSPTTLQWMVDEMLANDVTIYIYIYIYIYIFCHRFCLMYYMDDLSVNLKKCPTGCIAGGTVVNHLMYADDIVLLSPSATGLSLLLHVCGKYGLDHDIRFNSKKSAVIICPNSSVKDFSFPSFEMNGESIKEVPFVKYLGHVISADMKDDLDIMRQCRQVYAQGNALAYGQPFSHLILIY